MAPTCCRIMITCNGWHTTLLAIDAAVNSVRYRTWSMFFQLTHLSEPSSAFRCSWCAVAAVDDDASDDAAAAAAAAPAAADVT